MRQIAYFMRSTVGGYAGRNRGSVARTHDHSERNRYILKSVPCVHDSATSQYACQACLGVRRMITSHAKLLTQLHEYVDEYIDYMSIRPEQSLVEANEELRKIIGELESLQAHPDQRAEAARLSQR